MNDQYKPYAAVYILFVQNGKTLLSERANTGYMDGMLGVPAGHLDADETLTKAAVREAEEEVGLVVQGEDLEMICLHHRKANREYIDVYFMCSRWEGEPQNMEPEKCAGVAWHDMDNLPENMIPEVKLAIENYGSGILYEELGWNN